MAAKIPVRLPRGSHNFSSVLSYAVLEWLLMLFLFIDGLFSYLVTRFARFCGLQTPCPICSRLDHILGNEKPGFYWDLICISHKSEISTSVYCHLHQKLADVRDMCEACLFSFAPENKSNSETYRSLVGKLRVDIDGANNDLLGSPTTVDSDDHHYSFYKEDAASVPLLTQDHVSTSPVPKYCSCCSHPFQNKSHVVRLLQSKPIGVDVAKAGISLSRQTGQNHQDLHNGSSMIPDDPMVSTTIKHPQNNDSGLSADIGYSELKVTSDSESDSPFSDVANGYPLVHGTRDLQKEFKNRSLQPDTITIFPNCLSTALSDYEVVDVSKAGLSLSCQTGQNHQDLHNGSSMISDEPTVSTTIKHPDDFGLSSLIGYSELKVTSDSESDVPFSDDDNDNPLAHGTRDLQKEFMNRSLHPDTITIFPNHLSTTLSDWEGVDVAKASISLSHQTDQNHQDLCNGSSMTPDEPMVSKHAENNDSRLSSHIGYSELKVTSDSESDIPFSDDDNDNPLADGTRDLQKELTNQSLQPDTITVFPNNLSTTLSDWEGVDAAKFSISLSRQTDQNHQDLCSGSSMTPDEPMVSKHAENNDSRLSSHIGYSELKVTSDSESDIPFSDDDNDNSLAHGTRDLQKEFMNRSLHPDIITVFPDCLSTTLSDEQTLAKLIHTDPNLLETSLSEKQLHDGHNRSNMSCTTSIGHGMEEIDWHQSEVRTSPPVPSEIITQPVPSDFSNSKSNIVDVGDIACISITLGGELSKDFNSIKMGMKTNQIMSCPDPPSCLPTDLNDAYKLAIGSKSSLASPTLTEIVTGRDTCRVHEDLKSLISQISTTGGLESPWNDLISSPRVNYQNDEFEVSDASSFAMLQNISERLSLQRNESGLESLGESTVSEIECESVIDRLKRQVELDRKSMKLLYKELEEERNASAIAANQALAMITRLQEEKAAIQMEALQYQRMMEAQAEYDQEALQKSNEVLSEREKKIHRLEAEIDSYRKQFGDDLFGGRKFGLCPDRIAPPRKLSYCTNVLSADMSPLDVGLSEARLKGSLLNFEDEKMYLSDCLMRLEEKLNLFLNDSVFVDAPRINPKDGIPLKIREDLVRENFEQENTLLGSATKNGGDSEQTAVRNDLESHHWEDLNQEKSQTEYAIFEKMGSKVINNGNQNETTLCSVSVDDRHSIVVDKGNDLVAFANEVSLLTERLEALEADQVFLERTINQLQNGNDGTQFIQEIAYHLRELRKIGITRQQGARQELKFSEHCLSDPSDWL